MLSIRIMLENVKQNDELLSVRGPDVLSENTPSTKLDTPSNRHCPTFLDYRFIQRRSAQVVSEAQSGRPRRQPFELRF